MISPLAYDPTRPSINVTETGGNLPVPIMAAQSFATPTSEARSLGQHTAQSGSTSDIDIGLMAELGRAATRGAEEAKASQPRWQPQAALPGRQDNAELAVPLAAPQTPASSMSAVSPIKEAVVEGCVTAVVATAGAIREFLQEKCSVATSPPRTLLHLQNL